MSLIYLPPQSSGSLNLFLSSVLPDELTSLRAILWEIFNGDPEVIGLEDIPQLFRTIFFLPPAQRVFIWSSYEDTGESSRLSYDFLIVLHVPMASSESPGDKMVKKAILDEIRVILHLPPPTHVDFPPCRSSPL